ncbi:MAG TPA: hypothetical protein VM733_20655 [Thermoanaerobaculia bacterium]|nr:hypothetical protein [Thermoanaerobaculia bacterium]
MATRRMYGPFHRLQSAEENELVASTGKVGGRPARNIAAGLFPKVKAYDGPLPAGFTGVEFFTGVAPDAWHVPGCPVWSGPRAGVENSIDDPDLVLIAVTIVKRVDS